jgi:hypothetical protein
MLPVNRLNIGSASRDAASMAAHVVPHDAGPDHLAGPVDGRGAMHVPRQSDAPKLGKLGGMGLGEKPDGRPRC